MKRNFAKDHHKLVRQAQQMGVDIILITEESYVRHGEKIDGIVNAITVKRLKFCSFKDLGPKIDVGRTNELTREIQKIGDVWFESDRSITLSTDYENQIIYLGFINNIFGDLEKVKRYYKLKDEMDKVTQKSDSDFLNSIFESLFPKNTVYRNDLEAFAEYYLTQMNPPNYRGVHPNNFAKCCFLFNDTFFELPYLYYNEELLKIPTPLSKFESQNPQEAFAKDFKNLRDLGILPVDLSNLLPNGQP